MKPLIFFLSLIFCSHLVFADYNPALGTEYAYTVALPYCPADAIEAWTCGAACKNLTGYKPYYAGLFNVSAGQNLSLAMIYNPSAQKFVTSFRGTVGNVELFSEIMEDIPVPYELIDLPNATVLKYFYTHYITYLRPTMVAKLQEAYKEFPDYSFVFAGHSLGGALTTIACFDAITSGYVPKEKVSLWNYGSPRVGNYEFAQAVVSTVPVIYRVTHWRDMGPHIPPCVTNGSGHCVPRNTSEEGPSVLIWPAWHIAPEVFYNLANTEYIVCNEAENRTCADQFDLPQTTFGEHYFYAGVHIACDGNSVIEGGVNEQEEKWESIELLERFKGWWGNL